MIHDFCLDIISIVVLVTESYCYHPCMPSFTYFLPPTQRYQVQSWEQNSISAYDLIQQLFRGDMQEV